MTSHGEKIMNPVLGFTIHFCCRSWRFSHRRTKALIVKRSTRPHRNNPYSRVTARSQSNSPFLDVKTKKKNPRMHSSKGPLSNSILFIDISGLFLMFKFAVVIQNKIHITFEAFPV
jgi:hypothetical protein